MRILDSLPFRDHARFLTTPLEPWYFSSSGVKTKGGLTKHVGNLAIVSVDEAGHMNPHDQPEATLHVLERWIQKRPLVS